MFWEKLKKPIFVLAPMANVTDVAFRSIIAKYGKPDVTWTEFVSADGLCSNGVDILLKDLLYYESERPIVAQLFSSNPVKMKKAAELVKSLGFDGIDINMGCPDKSIEKQGSGAAMIKDPESAKAVIIAARDGSGLPVSVKTRLGYNKIDLEWIRFLLSQDLPALTVHLRTRKEMSEVDAHWDLMPEIVQMRNEISPQTIIIGNGDVKNKDDGLKKIKESGCDGVMIGRGIFGNPWLFGPVKKDEVPIQTQIKVLHEHVHLFEYHLGKTKSYSIMKKHFKSYISGWDGAKELRNKLMETNSVSEFDNIIRDIIEI